MCTPNGYSTFGKEIPFLSHNRQNNFHSTDLPNGCPQFSAHARDLAALLHGSNITTYVAVLLRLLHMCVQSLQVNHTIAMDNSMLGNNIKVLKLPQGIEP